MSTPALGIILALLASAGPAGRGVQPTVAVQYLEARSGIPPDTAQVLTDHFVDALRRSKAFSRVVSWRELQAVLGLEREKQLVDCDTGTCVAEIMGALGVDYLVIGSIARLGSRFVFNVRLLDARSGTARASSSRVMCGRNEEVLLGIVKPVVTDMLVDARLARAPAGYRPLPDEVGCNAPAPAATHAGGGARPDVERQTSRALRWSLWGVAGGATGLAGLSMLATGFGALAAGAWTLGLMVSPEFVTAVRTPQAPISRFAMLRIPPAMLGFAAVISFVLTLGMVTVAAAAGALSLVTIGVDP